MIYTKRIGIFLVFLLLVTSCQDTVITVSDESRDDARESYLLELWLDGEDLDILDLRIFDEPSRPFPASEATIAYEYRRLSGSVIEEGEVADPRLIRSEFDERGEVDVHFARVDYGLLRLKIPGVAGTLYFLDSDGEPFTQIDLDPVHHVREFPLMGPDDVLGDAVKIVDHGESIGRADILFLPDGYTEEDMGRFRDDVQEILRNLKVHPDYKPIWSDLNFWRQDVISQQRGINETGRFRDTAFEAGPVGDSGRCFVPGPRGKRAIQELAGKIRADYVVVLLNSQTHAGCASPFMTSQTVTPTAYLVLAHELGHGLFGLGDEYPYGGSVTGRCAVGRPNISSSSKAADIPWQALLTTDVLPT
ncbi:MAG: M64 family metallopeptidase, partial [Bradymonadaceae bacterium]